MDILYTGPMVPNPVTLLSHPLLGQILGILKKQYDAVIIDAPPYGILADTAILASLSDITLYAVRSGKIDKRYLLQIQQLADQGKLPNMAYIINGVNFKSSSYSYYGYGYGYQYGYGSGEPRQTTRKQD
jgi:tyrosine-protein kinase Etk/Wzc